MISILGIRSLAPPFSLSDYGLSLKKFALTNVDYRYSSAFRLRIEAINSANSEDDPNIFLYQRTAVTPQTGETVDLYVGIAGIVDIADYPVGAPNNWSDFQHFRRSYVEIDVASITMANLVWASIKKQVIALLKAQHLLEERLALAESVIIGDSIRLLRFEPINVNFRFTGATRLRIEASAYEANSASLSDSLSDSLSESSNDIPLSPYIFLYQRMPANTVTDVVDDVFLGIASKTDMELYTEDEPDTEQDYPFFRLNYIELDMRSTAQADQLWSVLKTQIAWLNYVMQELVAEEIVDI